MALSKALLPEFDHEMANTRKTLERVPDDKFDWKPHEKSMTLGNLATHLSNLPMWSVYAIKQTSIDLAPVGEPPLKVEPATSRQEVLERFDESVKAAREAIEGASDKELFVEWSLLSGGQTILILPRVAVLRSFVMNHTIHHRAQLGLYLRLNDVPVPSIYGPSADESGM
ncbi:MAG: DinB family protein [Acidobacteria bacterium]|nr:DinB family protein [Acidobacteriota bacterium]